jgi:pectinesterase
VKQGWVMAPAGTSSTSHAFFVINNSSIYAESGADPSTMFLARPWSKFAQATVQSSNLADFINPSGWDVWNAGDERTSNVQFSEYRNIGPGSKINQRAAFSSQLQQPVSMQTVLGSTDWIDQAFTS